MHLFLDTETTGIPRRRGAHYTEHEVWPRVVSISWAIFREADRCLTHRYSIVQPDGYTIPADAARVHGITTEKARREGRSVKEVLSELVADIKRHSPDLLVAHNVAFDVPIVLAELSRANLPTDLEHLPTCCTMASTTKFCALPGPYGYKWPKLSELHRALFDTDFSDAHDARIDVLACAKCYFRIVELEIPIQPHV